MGTAVVELGIALKLESFALQVSLAAGITISLMFATMAQAATQTHAASVPAQ